MSVDHAGAPAGLLGRLEPPGYGAELRETRPLLADEAGTARTDDAAHARVLRTWLGINTALFVIEILGG